MAVNEKVQPILSCNLCQKLNLIRFNLDQFDSTVSAVECDDLKEQALKDIRKLDIDDSIKGILLEFPDVFEERVGEFERGTDTPNRAKHSSYKTTHKRCPIWIQLDYKITYKKGRDIIIVDALSRAPVEDDNFQFNFSEVNLLEFLAASEQTRDTLVSATKEDKDLQKLIKQIKQGFPMRYKVLESQLK